MQQLKKLAISERRNCMHKVLFDDAFFNLNSTGVARYCESFLKSLRSIKDESYELIILDRSGKLANLGYETIEYSEFDQRFVAADRLGIAEICKYHNIDLFMSSFFTFAPNVPNLALVYDLIPEKFGFHRHSRDWNSREIGITMASSYVVISESTKHDLVECYDFIDKNLITVAYPGLNLDIFCPPENISPSNLSKISTKSKYFMIVGSRFQASDYKNGRLIYRAISKGYLQGSEIVVVGGEELSAFEKETCSAAGLKITRVIVDDLQLADLYASAQALIYPSLYEGFGMPPLEALAVGTPVITTKSSSLPEATSNLSITISGSSILELEHACLKSQDLKWRNHIKNEGPKWARNFTWDQTAKAIDIAICKALNIPISKEDLNRFEILQSYTIDSAELQR